MRTRSYEYKIRRAKRRLATAHRMLEYQDDNINRHGEESKHLPGVKKLNKRIWDLCLFIKG
jgi:hypothetical protein